MSCSLIPGWPQTKLGNVLYLVWIQLAIDMCKRQLYLLTGAHGVNHHVNMQVTPFETPLTSEKVDLFCLYMNS